MSIHSSITRKPSEGYLPGWLNTEQAALYLGISPNTLKCWRSRDYGPVYHKLGKRIVRYCSHDLDAWASRRNTSSK